MHSSNIIKPKVKVFISVDTEHSIGGAFRNSRFRPIGNDKRIFCRIGNRPFGIPLIMDIADQYGFRVSFFLEVLNKIYFGTDESKAVCQYILNRGHDVQLHLHPNYLNFLIPDRKNLLFSDFMHRYSLDRQIELIGEAKLDLIKYGAPPPVAFRAGNYGADRNTLSALKKNGFLIDTSHNRAYFGEACKLDGGDIFFDADTIDDFWEFPVTNFIEQGIIGKVRYRSLDINGTSFLQMQDILRQAYQKGPKCITLVMHSFSFIRSKDDQYTKVGVRNIVRRRFEKLCRYLYKNKEFFEVLPFGELASTRLESIKGSICHYLPKSNRIKTVLRHLEQIIDGFPLDINLRAMYRNL